MADEFSTQCIGGCASEPNRPGIGHNSGINDEMRAAYEADLRGEPHDGSKYRPRPCDTEAPATESMQDAKDAYDAGHSEGFAQGMSVGREFGAREERQRGVTALAVFKALLEALYADRSKRSSCCG